MIIARKEDWKTTAMPSSVALLPKSNATFSSKEFDRIKIGLIPREMEDKWFIFFEANVLHIHRSWTGAPMYQVRFQEEESKVTIAEIWFNPEVYGQEGYIVDLSYELKMVEFIIKAILLGKHDAEFPIDPNVKVTTRNGYLIHRHGVVGNTTSNESQLSENSNEKDMDDK